MSTKDFSSKQESLIADYLGWFVVSGSGARDLHPGDILSDSWMGECKTHTTPGTKIQFNWKIWNKIVSEANSRFKYPVLFVDDGSQTIDKTWCMFPDYVISWGAVISDYPYSVKTNIIFDGDALNRRLILQNTDTRAVIYHLRNDKWSVNICKLTYFKSMFGEI